MSQLTFCGEIIEFEFHRDVTVTVTLIHRHRQRFVSGGDGV